jgi:hypothetical protein
LNDEQVRFFLNEYFGEVTPKHYARLRLMWPMSELHEAMWGTTQTGSPNWRRISRDMPICGSGASASM